MANKYVEKIEAVAKNIYDLLKSDRDVNVVCSGMTGEGKSTFATQLLKSYGRISGIPWNFKRMTWERKELLRWIDGDPKTKPGKNGLLKDQLPMYTQILADELFLLFYKRNWFHNEQIEAIGTLNMCRDRRLLLVGNVPNFFDLDGAFTSRTRFFCFVPRRGVAWIFQQENNPFTNDVWNTAQNKKILRNLRNPYMCSNFLCEVHFNDWTAKERAAYYSIRNIKRKKAIEAYKKDTRDKYRHIKKQRDTMIRLLFDHNNITLETLKKNQINNKELGITKISFVEVAEKLGISASGLRMIVNGDR